MLPRRSVQGKDLPRGLFERGDGRHMALIAGVTTCTGEFEISERLLPSLTERHQWPASKSSVSTPASNSQTLHPSLVSNWVNEQVEAVLIGVPAGLLCCPHALRTERVTGSSAHTTFPSSSYHNVSALIRIIMIRYALICNGGFIAELARRRGNIGCGEYRSQWWEWRRRADSNRRIEVLQTSALVHLATSPQVCGGAEGGI